MSITATTNPIDSLQEQYGSDVAPQLTCDGIPTFWTPRERVREILGYLKSQIDRPYAMLYDLTAIDERMRVNRQGCRPSAISRSSITCSPSSATSISG